MRYGATENPLLLTLVNPGKPSRRGAQKEKVSMAKAKRRKASKSRKRNPSPFTPEQQAKAAATRAAKSAARKAATDQTKALVKQSKAETQAKLDALKAQIAELKGKKVTVKGALKATKEATRAAKQAKKAQADVEKLRTGLEKRMVQVEKSAKKTKRQERSALVEASRLMGIGRVGKKGKRVKRGGKRRAGTLTAAQLTQLAGLTGAARTAAIKKARKQIMKAEMTASRPKRRGKSARRKAAAWGKQMQALGQVAESMPTTRMTPRPPKPSAPRPGYEGVRHLAALDAWRPYVKGKGTPGWYWTPPRSGGFKYHKNPKHSRRGGIVASTMASIKKFFGLKKGKRNPSTGTEILKNAIAGTGAFVTGRLIGNLATRSGWFGGYEKYTPVGASVVNVLIMHLASGRVSGLQPYRTALLTGAGIQLVETVIDAFAPANVNALFDRPGGMGADLNVYEAALQDDLGYSGYGMASDEELLAGVDMGEYLLPAEEDMGEYLSTGEMGEYVSLNDDDMGEYVAMSGSEDELADEAINELMGAQDDLAEELTEMGDEVLADEVLADDMADDLGDELGDDLGDDLGYDLGADAAPAPAPSIVANVPENVRKRGPRAIAAYRNSLRRRQTAAQRKAAALARAAGHPAGAAKGQILTGTTSGGVFGQMAAAPKTPAAAAKIRAATRKVIPRVGGAVGTPAHFAQVQAKVAQATGATPAAALVAYRAETAGPQAALRAARRMGVAKGAKARVVVRRGTGGMLEFTRPTTKRALVQPRTRSVYDKPLKEDEQGVFKGDIFSGDRI
jgi:hypothetical protein